MKKYRIRKDIIRLLVGRNLSKWSSPDGAELESCRILTTEPNELVKPLHRMPVVAIDGFEEQWTEQVKDANELKGHFQLRWVGRRMGG